MNSDFQRIAITTGDPDGIGFEITAKALSKIGPQKKISFFIYRDWRQEKNQARYFQIIDSAFSRLTFHDAASALAFHKLLILSKSFDHNFIFDICSKKSAADWVVDATELCKNQSFHSLVTAPITKTLIRKSGYSFVGHTGIFRHFFPKSDLFMGFVGQKFNVVLATDHVALSAVEFVLKKNNLLKKALHAAHQLSKELRLKKPIAVLGLNPHAGEKGVIASFEKQNSAVLIKSRRVTHFLSPDAAFFPNNWNKYSCYLALYHDQGLIPFKLVHGQDSGVHITMGLPFIRTSVDHGTAKDIFNKNQANANSMQDAIKLNLKLLKKRYTI
ncbi:MAG: 4-hydroxythreonine-4-phosphate dehydrogenase PdxA [Pseudobdellovibrio sp.]